jgi:hypothetical protein
VLMKSKKLIEASSTLKNKSSRILKEQYITEQ